MFQEGVEPYPGYDKHVRRAIILLLISVNIHTSSWDVSIHLLYYLCINVYIALPVFYLLYTLLALNSILYYNAKHTTLRTSSSLVK